MFKWIKNLKKIWEKQTNVQPEKPKSLSSDGPTDRLYKATDIASLNNWFDYVIDKHHDGASPYWDYDSEDYF